MCSVGHEGLSFEILDQSGIVERVDLRVDRVTGKVDGIKRRPCAIKFGEIPIRPAADLSVRTESR
jgi:hypothetical protein